MFIPQTKTNPSGEDIFWAEQEGVTNPKAAFDKHLDVNPGPPSAPLFAYLKITKNALVGRLAKAARDAGLDPLQGHGIRIGSTLEYLLRGVSIETMKMKGHWGSDAFQPDAEESNNSRELPPIYHGNANSSV
ncbi:hypothetical protein C8J56DRAFT_1052833 [Mycena floridula]|nr:hypothetical protein C8J56DRAFT_1052833 [Mycena floridula]